MIKDSFVTVIFYVLVTKQQKHSISGRNMVYLGDCLSVHQDRLNLAGLFPGLKRRLFWSEPKACPGRKITYAGGKQIDMFA